MSLEKMMALSAAAELTKATCALITPVAVVFDPAKPGIVPDTVKALNLQVWELERIFYSAVVQAFADDQNWPSPVPPAGSAVSPTASQVGQAVGQGIAPAITALAPLISGLPQVIAQILAAAKGQVPTAPAPVVPVPPPSSAPGGVSVGAQVKVGS